MMSQPRPPSFATCSPTQTPARQSWKKPANSLALTSVFSVRMLYKTGCWNALVPYQVTGFTGVLDFSSHENRHLCRSARKCLCRKLWLESYSPFCLLIVPEHLPATAQKVIWGYFVHGPPPCCSRQQQWPTFKTDYNHLIAWLWDLSLWDFEGAILRQVNTEETLARSGGEKLGFCGPIIKCNSEFTHSPFRNNWHNLIHTPKYCCWWGLDFQVLSLWSKCLIKIG